MTSLASGTALNLPSGMKPGDSSRLLEPDVREAWEESVLGLGEN
jgi:hypothetical protein